MNIICGSCKTSHSSKEMIALCTKCCTNIGDKSQATNTQRPEGSALNACSVTDADRVTLVHIMEKFELAELIAAVVAQAVIRDDMETAEAICNALNK